MSAEQNKAIVRRWIEEAWNQGNLSVVDEIVATNYVGHLPGFPHIQGLEGHNQVFTLYHTAFSNFWMTIDDLISEGDKVVVRWTFRGTHQGDFMGIPPTEKPVQVPAIVMHRIATGKVVESWYNIDFLGLMQQLGVVPTIG